MLLDAPLAERRARLEALLADATGLVRPTRSLRVTTAEEIEKAFGEALDRGNEGVLVKDPASPYRPGRRGRSWMKVKKPMATLDVVVTGVEYGHGKRKGVLSDYTFAVRDGSQLRNLGKAFTGLTDREIAELTETFEGSTLEERRGFRRVRAEVVLEVAFNNIQISSRHESGYALRFPRIVRLRPDKTVDDIDTLDRVRELFAKSRPGPG